MPKRRKKKIVRVIHQSAGPLPLRLAERFSGCRLIFSDASRKRHGGLAVVLFGDSESLPLVATRSVALAGSNELELAAALFGLEEAQRQFPGEPAALFSDNQDAVVRLGRAKAEGLGLDPALARMLAERGLASVPDYVSVCWVQGHAACRGNALADQHARAAAG